MRGTILVSTGLAAVLAGTVVADQPRHEPEPWQDSHKPGQWQDSHGSNTKSCRLITKTTHPYYTTSKTPRTFVTTTTNGGNRGGFTSTTASGRGRGGFTMTTTTPAAATTTTDDAAATTTNCATAAGGRGGCMGGKRSLGGYKNVGNRSPRS